MRVEDMLEKTKATIWPSGLTFVCPVCGERQDLIEDEIERAEDGSISTAQEKVRCSECDWLVEVGHTKFTATPTQPR